MEQLTVLVHFKTRDYAVNIERDDIRRIFQVKSVTPKVFGMVPDLISDSDIAEFDISSDRTLRTLKEAITFAIKQHLKG